MIKRSFTLPILILCVLVGPLLAESTFSGPSPTAITSLPAFPACAIKCAQQSDDGDGCGDPLDSKCLCTNLIKLASVVKCTLGDCAPVDQDIAFDLLQAQCGPLGIPFNPSSEVASIASTEAPGAALSMTLSTGSDASVPTPTATTTPQGNSISVDPTAAPSAGTPTSDNSASSSTSSTLGENTDSGPAATGGTNAATSVRLKTETALGLTLELYMIYMVVAFLISM
ncbi:hypothetical protein C8Q79DRAFT_735137 [Trametes meyenii]|nr:hypothetical protein C8Q79DRAFT_735137 [Trametes meyenii]